MRAAALEVMDRFSDFLRRWVTDQEELKRISYRVQEFFRQLEEELNHDLLSEVKGVFQLVTMNLNNERRHGGPQPAQGSAMTLNKKLTKSEFRQRADKIMMRLSLEVMPFWADSEEKRKQRLERSARDPLYFCRTYLPHYFPHAPAPFHHELIKMMEKGGMITPSRWQPSGAAKLQCAPSICSPSIVS
jgi:hypothetical protein